MSDRSLSTEQREDFFRQSLLNPTFHWFFTQGQIALTQELYIPGVSALLNGIEASLRVTMLQIGAEYADRLELSNYRLLSNTLLRQARHEGVPVSTLAFPGELDFLEKLEAGKEDVELVQLRHDVCHGNILRFTQRMEFEQIDILSPECLRGVAAILLGMSFEWAHALALFRASKGRRPPNYEIPAIPSNPLAKWLPKQADCGAA